MENNHNDIELDKIIRDSIKLTDEPSVELNNILKAAIYQQETAMKKVPTTHSLSLWYLPMILNLITFFMLAVVSLIAINNTYMSYFFAGVCSYIGLAGVLLTVVGVKRTNIKQDITIYIQKRGDLE